MQAAVMSTHGVPNDVLSNLDPLALVIRVFIPIFDVVVRCFLVGVYSLARRYSLTFQLKKITAGFFTGAVSRSMVWAASSKVTSVSFIRNRLVVRNANNNT